MAAVRRRNRSFPQAEFEIPLADAVVALVAPDEVETGDSWHFQVSGESLLITRTRAPVDIPPRGPGGGNGNGGDNGNGPPEDPL
jgi:hypothetical protein